MNQLTGNCPKCGAPIWSVPNPAAPIPQTVFTCECRHKVEAEASPWRLVPWYVPTPIYPTTPVIPLQPYIGDPIPYGPTWGSSTCKFPNINIGGGQAGGGGTGPGGSGG